MLGGRAAWLLVLPCLAACTFGHDLIVELRTDYVPELEFDAIVVNVGDDATTVPADATANYRSGVRIATRSDLGGGAVSVEVALERAGATVASRRVLVTLDADQAIVVVIDRGAPTDGGTMPDAASVGDAAPVADGAPVVDAGRDGSVATDAGVDTDAGAGTFIAMYVPTDTHNGVFPGRAGLDTFCASRMPNPSDFVGCENVHAFVTTGPSDQLIDMPTRYGYATTVPIRWYDPRTRAFTSLVAEEWSSLFDGSIVTGQGVATGNLAEAWTGSTASGFVDATCGNWRYGASSTGTVGDEGISSTWLSTGTRLNCAEARVVRCICQRGP